ncbi:MAG: Rrf2 family transcriptional regulator [Kiritimatiellia bacterium]|jgi:DNA-binding IscR family transcriptional regulator
MLGLLNISEAMSIALHACVWLADDPERFHSARRMAAKLGFSPHHCAKILQQLVRSGILETERGPAGGARLARPPAEVTLLEIYGAVGGNPAYKGCLLKRNICKGDACALGKLMSNENKRLIGLLKDVTLAGVVSSLKKNRSG